MTRLNLHAEVLSHLTEAHVGDGWKNRLRSGSDVSVVLHTEEVCSPALVEIFLLLGVDVEHYGVAELVSLLTGNKRCGIVTAHLYGTCALGSHTVVFAAHADLCGLEAFLEIRTHGSHKHDDHVFARGLNAYAGSDTDFEGTYI